MRAVPQAEHVRVELDPAPVLAAYARHRRQFAREVQALDADALATPSRCAGWSVADVLRHCIDADGWIQAIWTGAALPFDNFDPTRTPDQFVVAGRAVPDREVRGRYGPSADVVAADVIARRPEQWGDPSLSPLGPVPWWLSAVHMFYDSWLHRRDVLLPLGQDPGAVADETLPMMAYSLAVVGILSTEPSDAEVAGLRMVKDEGPVVVTAVDGSAADPATQAAIIDAISGRGSLEETLPGEDPALVHRLGVLARIFNPQGV
jgi:uncharacterized protein (TIGR03083 family)